MSKRIAIIGGGNLGTAIAEGLLKSKFTQPASLTLTRRNVKMLQPFAQKGVAVLDDNLQAVKNSDVIIMAVKPYQILQVLKQVQPALNAKKMLISVVTGISISEMQAVIKKKMPLFRAMPNTAIAIQESMTCICSTQAVEEDSLYVMELFSTVGKTVTIDEKLMEAATILGACGTAYAMRYIRASIQGGIEIGFDAKTASLIAAQTVKGAAELLLKKNTHPEEEIDKVTTPKGCTIAGLNEMEHRGFSSSLIRGITASYNKIAKD